MKIIKRALRKFLGIEDEMSKLGCSTTGLFRKINQQEIEIGKLQTEIGKLKNLVHIGVDACDPRYSKYGDRSWAVICLAGKVETVRFYQMDFDTIVGLKKILKQFEGYATTIDAPSYFRL